jgi:hypothetical protein
MVVEFFRAWRDEMAWGKIDAWLKENFPAVVATIDRSGLLERWLILADGGESVWRSGMNPKLKRQLKEALTSDSATAHLITEDPRRLVDMVLASFNPELSKKIAESAPPEYWVKQIKIVLKDARLLE